MQKVIKKGIIGLKELRENMEAYIARVDKGESFTVVRRSRPVFRVSPVDTDESGWETVVDFTEIQKEGVSAQKILRAIRALNGKA